MYLLQKEKKISTVTVFLEFCRAPSNRKERFDTAHPSLNLSRTVRTHPWGDDALQPH